MCDLGIGIRVSGLGFGIWVLGYISFILYRSHTNVVEGCIMVAQK